MSDAMLYVVGLGPGDARYLTAQAQTALQAADVLCGYTVYIDLVRPLYPDKEVYTTGMTKEIDRCRWALETAQSGKTVALVCSGDAGVYGMASPLLELAQGYPSVTVEIVPGLTALYNPSSKDRADYLQKAVRILLQNGKAPQTICGIVRNIGREGQAVSLLTLAELENTAVDMFTTVYIGNAATRALGGKMVTPRGYRGV
mgnify:CR=1 FL=1